MKFSVFFLSFFISSLSLISQVGVPTRTVLHTLSKNEVLYSDEYYTFQSANKNGYSCVINDTIRSKETLIFNGKIIHSFDYVWRNIFEIDLSKENGYVFKYWESEKCFVNFRDQIMGPFEEATNEIYEIYSTENYKIPTNYNFFYKLGGSWYSFYEGKAQMLEIDKNDKDDIENAWPTYGSTGDKGKWYLSSIDGEDYTDKIRYDELVRVTKNNVIVAYICVINGNKYVVLNGVLSEPLDNVSEYSIQLNGRNYMYSYIKNKKKYLNVNGKSLEIDCDDNPYGEILSNGTYYFSYTKKNKQFVNINGKVFGPYNGMNYSTQLHENGKFAFIFEKDNLFYLNNNGSISKGYPYIFDLETQPDGFFKYNFSMEDGWVYENANGQIKKTQDRKIGYGKGAFLPSIDKYVIQSKNKSHTLSIDLAYDYVVIDGKSYGKAPAIKAWYDETKNCFIWNSWEGKELVIYEFKLD
jgi:hypothetical protein